MSRDESRKREKMRKPTADLKNKRFNIPDQLIESVPTTDPMVLQELEMRIEHGLISKSPTQVKSLKMSDHVSNYADKLEREVSDYIDTAKKWEEIGLYDNVAISFACAALSTYLLRDASFALKLLSEFMYSSSLNLTNHPAFRAVKSLLMSVIKKDKSQLTKVVSWTRQITFRFDEDREVFLMAINKLKTDLKIQNWDKLAYLT